MSRTRTIAGVLVAAILAWLVAPHLFAEFASVREKVVRTDLAATGEQLRVPIAPDAALENLRAPFSLIARVRNEDARSLVMRIALDDREVCAAEVPAGTSRRIDCAVRESWTGRASHSALLSTTSPRFTVEYLELATHYGALTPGPRNLIIGPSGFSASRPSSAGHVFAIFVLFALTVWSVGDRRMPAVVSVVHLALTAIVGIVVAAVVLSASVSEYSLLISDRFLEKLLLLTALPMLTFAAHALWVRLTRSSVLPMTRAIGIGVIVGAVFLAFAARQVTERYQGQASGLLLISHTFFDKSPMARDRDDIRPTLHFDPGGGYDGQFFYFMAFDPFLTRFREEPRRYDEYFDLPPYRYGRIGFSLLTKIVSVDRPALYPVTMVALVIGSLAVCGTLLAAIAQRNGRSAWYGLLVVLIPGFRQSVESALPEPLAIACVLAAYLCVLRRRWWAGGALLGGSMLVRETSGALVLAVAAGVLLAGKRREALIVACLAFVPVVLWKAFVGWVFWPVYGMNGVAPHPEDVGLPLAGVWNLWSVIARGEYFGGLWELTRASAAFAILTTAGAVLAWIAVVKRPGPVAAAAAFYALLTVTFNYESVWLAVGNAQRLTIDLFLALALVFLQPAGQRVLTRPFAVFWCASAWYVFYGTYDATFFRESLLAWIF